MNINYKDPNAEPPEILEIIVHPEMPPLRISETVSVLYRHPEIAGTGIGFGHLVEDNGWRVWQCKGQNSPYLTATVLGWHELEFPHPATAEQTPAP